MAAFLSCSSISPRRGEAFRGPSLEPPANKSLPKNHHPEPLRPTQMGIVNTVILLLHPILACVLLGWIWWQYGWKSKSRNLKGKERREQIDYHEKVGERILISAIIIVLIAFAARWYTGKGLMPTQLHGFTGPVGIILLWIMSRWGRAARTDKISRKKHGRAADLLIALVFFHSFLGFLYIFSII